MPEEIAADFLERVRKGKLADVVQEGRQQDAGKIILGHGLPEAGIGHQRVDVTDRMRVHPKRMLEAGMGGSGINQVCEAQLAHMAQPLKPRVVDQHAHPVGEGHAGQFRHADDVLRIGREFGKEHGFHRGSFGGEWVPWGNSKMHLAPFGRAFVSLFLLHRDFGIPMLSLAASKLRDYKIPNQPQSVFKKICE